MTDSNDRPLVRYANVIFDRGRWEGFALRPDDIVISTPPKCGTTWTQMMIALLVFQTPDLPAPLAHLSPWLDMRTRARREVVADLEAQQHRRFIKTHTPLAGLPLVPGVTYITVGRDPRDVALSMGDHMATIDFGAFLTACAAAAETDGVPMPALPPLPPEDLDQTDRAKFWRWVREGAPATSGTSSLLVTLTHVQSFWDVRDTANVMLHSADLKTDLEEQMRDLAGRLGIDVPEEKWPADRPQQRHRDLARPDRLLPQGTEWCLARGARHRRRPPAVRRSRRDVGAPGVRRVDAPILIRDQGRLSRRAPRSARRG